ncbi:polysaccharide biosynthesis/export protein [Azospirillaceae bacterium]
MLLRIGRRLHFLIWLFLSTTGNATEEHILSQAPVEEPSFLSPIESLSPVETLYSSRIGAETKQFGYELFTDASDRDAPNRIASETTQPPIGAVQGHYMLGVGDALTIAFRGQTSNSRHYVIDREGQLIVENLPPIVAVGQTLDALRQELTAEVKRTQINTEVYVSLAEMRRIGVWVVGETLRPGRKTLTAFATIPDALLASGGVTRMGSLRRLRLIHAGQTESEGRPIDLYGLLYGGALRRSAAPDAAPEARDAEKNTPEPHLRDGDRLVAPPLGPTVAVVGAVRRPGIYEISPDRSTATLNELLRLAGGALRPGATRAIRLSYDESGAEQTSEVPTSESNAVFSDGDVLLLSPTREDRVGEVRLEGHVRRPGPRSIAEAITTGGLIDRRDLLPRPYLPFAAIETTDPVFHTRKLEAVDLQALLDGRDSRSLRDGDVLITLGEQDVAFLSARPVLEILRGDQLSSRLPRCAGLNVLARAMAGDSKGFLARGPLVSAAVTLPPADAPCPTVFDRHPDLLAFALNHAALLKSNVIRPGLYPVAQNGAKFADVALSAGGHTLFETPAKPEDAASTEKSRKPSAKTKPPAKPSALNNPDASLSATRQNKRVNRGDIIDASSPSVDIQGPVRRPGVRSLAEASTLRRLLKESEPLETDFYPLFGIIDRFDPQTMARRFLPFSPLEVVKGAFERPLTDGDRVRVFSRSETRRAVHDQNDETNEENRAGIENSPAPIEKSSLPHSESPPLESAKPDDNAETKTSPLTIKNQRLFSRNHPTSTLIPQKSFRPHLDAPSRVEDITETALNPEKKASPIAVIEEETRFIREHAVRLRGAVRHPGLWPLAVPTPLDTFLAVVGGLTSDADPTQIELSRHDAEDRSRTILDLRRPEAERTLVEPGDIVHATPLFRAHVAGYVAVLGEVRRPGRYDITRDETLLSLLRRAGGLTEQAYPAGAIFTRVSAQRAEAERQRRMAQSLDNQLAMDMMRSDPPRPEQIAAIRQLTGEMRKLQPLGRITVEADPSVLEARPEQDSLLEAGDRILIPRRPLTVSVVGEVQSPAALQFASGKTVERYVEEAGGLTRNADDDRLFLVMPDGSARSLSDRAWKEREILIPPGATIVAPRDPHPFDWLETAKSLSGILGQLALTAASIAVISNY